MKIVEATCDEVNGYSYAVHLDPSKTVPSPDEPLPAKGQPDERTQVPDPAFVMVRVWGYDPPEKVSREQYEASHVVELAALAKIEAAKLGATDDAEPVEVRELAVKGRDVSAAETDAVATLATLARQKR